MFSFLDAMMLRERTNKIEQTKKKNEQDHEIKQCIVKSNVIIVDNLRLRLLSELFLRWKLPRPWCKNQLHNLEISKLNTSASALELENLLAFNKSRDLQSIPVSVLPKATLKLKAFST